MLQVIISPAKQMRIARDTFAPRGIPPFPQQTERLREKDPTRKPSLQRDRRTARSGEDRSRQTELPGARQRETALL